MRTSVRLKLPVAVLDCETTGLDPTGHYVVELSILLATSIQPLVFDAHTFRFKPPIAMPDVAFRIHGLSDSDLAPYPAFGDYTKEIYSLLEMARSWCGYRVRFDIGMLESEFRRANRQLPPQYGRTVIDVFDLWKGHTKAGGRLTDLYHEVIGEEACKPHSSYGDALATLRLLAAKLV
jgi:DNA polymerase III epsilon subunit-like protein